MPPVASGVKASVSQIRKSFYGSTRCDEKVIEFSLENDERA